MSALDRVKCGGGAGGSRWCGVVAWLVFALWVGVVVMGLGAVMRESDQASLLDGVLRLSRDGVVWDRDFYQYDKAWVSYCLVALMWAVVSAVGEMGLPDLVLWGNAVAMVVGVVGLGLAWRRAAALGWQCLVVLGVMLWVPTVLFSMPLLSMNVISAGFLGAWVWALGMGERGASGRWWQVLLVGGLALMAVGARADAVLVLPAVVVARWGVGRSWLGRDWRKFFGDSLVWASVVGAVLALLMGRFLAVRAGSMYSTFFQWQTFAAYLVFGLGGVLVLYAGCAWRGVMTVARGEVGRWWVVVWLGLLALPLLFYGRLLFTPRHLWTAALVVGLSACVGGGAVWWRGVLAGWGRGWVVLSVVAVLVPMVVGVELSSLRSGRVVVGSGETRYPTADGWWPMGNYGHFMWDLGRAEEVPIDHNQRLWGAWLAADSHENAQRKAELFASGVGIRSQNLVSLGMLWARWRGVDVLRQHEGEREVLLGDDRSMMKRVLSIKGEDVGRDPVTEGDLQVWGEWAGGRVGMLVEDVERLDESERELAVMLEALRERAPGRAYVIRSVSEWKGELSEGVGGGYEWLMWVAGGEDQGGGGWQAIRQEDLTRWEQACDVWLARSELPVFFNLSGYRDNAL